MLDFVVQFNCTAARKLEAIGREGGGIDIATSMGRYHTFFQKGARRDFSNMLGVGTDKALAR